MITCCLPYDAHNFGLKDADNLTIVPIIVSMCSCCCFHLLFVASGRRLRMA